MDAINCEEMLTKAIEVGVSNQKMLTDMLLERDLLRVDGELLDKYLNMYANNQSICMQEDEINSLNELYSLGYKHKIYDKEIDINNYFIPSEYKELRLC